MRDLGLFADRVLDRVAARRRRAGSTANWSFATEATSLRALAGEAVGVDAAGLAALDDFEARMTDLIEASLAEHLDGPAAAAGVALSEVVFGTKSYANRLDRQLAVGASAVALTFAEESGLAAVSEALRLSFLRGGDAAPALPPGSYLVGRGAAPPLPASDDPAPERAGGRGPRPDASAGSAGEPSVGPAAGVDGVRAPRRPPERRRAPPAPGAPAGAPGGDGASSGDGARPRSDAAGVTA